MDTDALLDSGSTDSFVHPDLVEKLALPVSKSTIQVKMASTSLSSKVTGVCVVDIYIANTTYPNIKLNIMKNLCTDVILGLDFQTMHESVTLLFGGTKPPLVIGALNTLNAEPPSLFENLTSDCKPVATKSRMYSNDDRKFIQRLLACYKMEL